LTVCLIVAVPSSVRAAASTSSSRSIRCLAKATVYTTSQRYISQIPGGLCSKRCFLVPPLVRQFSGLRSVGVAPGLKDLGT
jgi:hypothetical protein